jgi:hypothetical protein
MLLVETQAKQKRATLITVTSRAAKKGFLEKNQQERKAQKDSSIKFNLFPKEAVNLLAS